MAKIFKCGKFELGYSIHGDRKKMPLVVIHPGVGRYHTYEHMIARFSEKYCVISIDLPGSGRTRCLRAENAVPHIARVISKLFKKLHLKNPVIFASSYGGVVALECAHFYKVRSLVLLCTGEFRSWWNRLLLRVIHWPSLFSHYLRAFWAKLYGYVSGKKGFKLHKQELKMLTDRWYNFLRYQLPQETKIKTKTLLFTAQHDALILAPSLKKLKHLLPDHREVITPCGHCKQLEMVPDLVFQEIEGFIGKG